MINFDEELYGAMCKAFPETTVRSISRAMGMSDGYWSSVTSQGLKISNSALIHLNEHLDVQRIRFDRDSAKSRLVKFIQTMIAREIVKRFSHEVELMDKVWDEASLLGYPKDDEISGVFGAMPFVMVRG